MIKNIFYNVLLAAMMTLVLAGFYGMIKGSIDEEHREKTICEQTFGKGWKFKAINRRENLEGCIKDGELKYL